MPEGPEIANMSRYLDKKIKGKTIVEINVYPDSKYKPNDFDALQGKKISFVDFKGKKIIFAFTDKTYFISSLGLEGRWEFLHFIDNVEKCSIIIHFEDNSYLVFYDQRHFGNLLICSSLDCIKHVGPSWIPSKLFPEKITKKDFYTMLTNKRLKKKSIMMFLNDQKYTSGVGTYIRADVLYLSKINPHRLVNNITEEESDVIYDNINKVMKMSYELSNKYKYLVYDQAYSSDTNHKVLKEFDSQKRNIYWCPEIQV